MREDGDEAGQMENAIPLISLAEHVWWADSAAAITQVAPFPPRMANVGVLPPFFGPYQTQNAA